MYHRVPGFLAVDDLAPCHSPPPPSIFRQQVGRGREEEGAKSYDGENAWSSIIHEILSGVDCIFYIQVRAEDKVYINMCILVNRY